MMEGYRQSWWIVAADAMQLGASDSDFGQNWQPGTRDIKNQMRV
jgi:hypothetical protein